MSNGGKVVQPKLAIEIILFIIARGPTRIYDHDNWIIITMWFLNRNEENTTTYLQKNGRFCEDEKHALFCRIGRGVMVKTVLVLKSIDILFVPDAAG